MANNKIIITPDNNNVTVSSQGKAIPVTNKVNISEDNKTITVTEDNTSIIVSSVGLQGAAGPTGPAGADGQDFPYTGSAIITGSLEVIGNFDLSGSQLTTGSLFISQNDVNDPWNDIGRGNTLRTNTNYVSEDGNISRGVWFSGTRTGSLSTITNTAHTNVRYYIDVTGSGARGTAHIGLDNRMQVDNGDTDNLFAAYNAVTLASSIQTSSVGQVQACRNDTYILGSGKVDTEQVYSFINIVGLYNPNATTGDVRGFYTRAALSEGSASAFYAIDIQQDYNSNFHISGDYALIWSNETTVPIVGGNAYNIYLAANMESVLGGDLTVRQGISASNAITGSDVYINDWGSVSASLATLSSSVPPTPTFQQVTDQGATTTNDVVISGSLNVTEILTAREFHTEYVSSSIIYESGSTKFGDSADDVHQFTGSIYLTNGTADDSYYPLNNAKYYHEIFAKNPSSTTVLNSQHQTFTGSTGPSFNTFAASVNFTDIDISGSVPTGYGLYQRTQVQGETKMNDLYNLVSICNIGSDVTSSENTFDQLENFGSYINITGTNPVNINYLVGIPNRISINNPNFTNSAGSPFFAGLWNRLTLTTGSATDVNSIFLENQINSNFTIEGTFANIAADSDVIQSTSGSYNIYMPAAMDSVLGGTLILQSGSITTGSAIIKGDISGSGNLTISRNDSSDTVFTLNSSKSFGRPFTITNNGLEPTINAQDILNIQADGGNAEIKLDASGLDYISFKTNTTEAARIDNDGRLGIGTTTPTEKLTVSGSISASGDVYIGTNANLRGGQSGGINIYPNQSTGNGRIQVGQSDTVFYAVPRPAVNNNTNLGSVSQRWATVYTANLDVSGSLIAGYTGSNVHQFTGSLSIQSGSIEVGGNAYVSESLAISGSLVQHGSNYLVPSNISADAGDTIVLTGSLYDHTPMVKITHQRGSAGDITLELPNAEASGSIYRTIRFIGDSSIDNTHRAIITPSGSQTLDGGTSGFTMNRSYEGIMVWSDGTEWFQVQAKNV